MSAFALPADDVPCLGAFDGLKGRDSIHSQCDRLTQTTATSGRYFHEPAQTLIFLDFDDTIFPTTELFHRWGLPSDVESWGDLQLTPEQARQLSKWQAVIYEYFSTACAISDRVVILTNARRPWVDDCLKRFAPNLASIFQRERSRPRVVYAIEYLKRTSRPAIYLDKNSSREEREAELTQGKLAAMRAETKRFYKQYPGQTWKNIMSVGDAPYEKNAMKDLAFQRNCSSQQPDRERLRHKVIRTPSAPSVNDLTYRLQLATVLFTAYVRFDGDIDLDMNTPERLTTIADALAIPELKEAIFLNPIREENEAEVAETLSEVAVIVQNAMTE